MNKGQSLFEVVLAIFIITLVIVAVVVLSTQSISNSIISKNRTLASKYTQEAMEWLRSERELSFDDFMSNVVASSNYCLQALSFDVSHTCNTSETIDGSTVFKREVRFDVNLTSNTVVTANVVTYWTDSKGIHEARSITDFTDIREQ